jgi:alkanesulfonate monooxygenase SsuD/methylene tetrahydromethanopterin reductase-like flavin-dependent oxidoreductase (luciferase family)
MLRLAGERADGTITWMAGPRTIREHITPRIGRAAEASGREAPRVCVGLPTTVCDDEAVGRRQAAEAYERYGQLVNYRRVLDIEDVEGPSEVAVIGNEDSLRRQLEEFASGGATDFMANIFAREGDTETGARTYAALKDLVGRV